MTTPTRQQLLDMQIGAAALAAWLAADTASLNPDYSSLKYTPENTSVPPGATSVGVPVVLNAPSNQTEVVEFLTANGTVNEGSAFTRTQGFLVFQPGEQRKIVHVPVLKPFGPTDNFKLTVAWPQNSPILTGTSTSALVTGDQSVGVPDQSEDNVPLPAPPSGTPFFEEDFTAFQATDSGYLPNGNPCWRSRLRQGYEQVGNKEYGAYVNPEHNRGVLPFLTDANGQFMLQSEFHPNGVLLADGSQAICSWSGQPYLYTAPVITTEKLPSIRLGDYAEVKLTLPTVLKSWPAAWVLTKDNSLWPQLEFDWVEGFYASTIDKNALGSTVHWKDDTGNGKMFSTRIGFTQIDPTQPHTFGMWWRRDQVIYYLDGKPFFAFPNVWDDVDCCLILNIAVGGNSIGTPPSDGAGWPVKMPVQSVKFVRP